MIPTVPTNQKELSRLLKRREGPTLEFKRSTGELREGMQTVCAFLNGSGGMVLFGVRPDGRFEGLQVSDHTLRDISQSFDRFEPPVNVPVERVPLESGREILILPPDAMREILVNALIHRDYTIAGGAVSLAIFDDRVEVWSAGGFPKGITPDSLTRNHLSVQRNPIIADVFYRTELIEKWGRGTNRVIEMCRAAAISPPQFEEITGAAVVTFRVNVAGVAGRAPQVTGQLGAKSELESELESLTRRVLTALRGGPLGKGFLARALGQKQASGPLHRAIRVLLAKGLIERTIPDKPNSRLQRYRLTTKGQDRGTL